MKGELKIVRFGKTGRREEVIRDLDDMDSDSDDDGVIVFSGLGRVIREFQLGYAHNSGLIFYVRKSERAYKNRQGDLLARLICLRDSHVTEVMMSTDSARLIEEECTSPALTDILIKHVECMQALLARDVQLAFNRQIACTLRLTNLLETPYHQNEEWTLQLLYSVAVDTRLVTARAASTGFIDIDNANLDVAADTLLSCFRLCTSPGSRKRAGMLGISNQLVSIFFLMKKYGIFRPVLSDLEPNAINVMFPFAPQRATFQNFAHADDFYDFAFHNCPLEYDAYKRLILIRLVPLKMAKGVMPNQSLMQSYDLSMLFDLGVAMETGNLSLFDRIVCAYTPFFLRHGIYNFITQHLRYDTQRNAEEINYNLGRNNYMEIAINMYQQAVQVNANGEADREAARAYMAYYWSQGTFKRYYMVTNQVFFPQNAVLPRPN